MMGEEKRLEARKNPAEKREQDRKGKNELKGGKKNLIATGVLATSLVLGGLAGCGSNKDGPTDAQTDDDVAGEVNCEKTEKARANLEVKSGWGTVTAVDETDEIERRCSQEKCQMGINEGEEIIINTASNGEERWVVESVNADSEGALVVLKDPESDRTIEMQTGGSLYTDGIDMEFIDVKLVGVCEGGTCENGVSADVENADGKAILLVTVGEASKRVMLSDGEAVSVEVGGRRVELLLAKATESQAYVIVDEAELGAPVTEGEEMATEAGTTVKNEVSSDNATVQCSTLSVTLEITDLVTGDPPEVFEAEFVEGGTLFIGEKAYEVRSILPEIIVIGGVERVNTDYSAVRLVETSSGDELVRYVGEEIVLDDAGKRVTVKAINVDRPRD